MLLCLGFTTSTGTASEINVNNQDQIDEGYTNFIMPVYNRTKDYGVFNKEGNDVTELFITDTKDFNNNKQYEKIREYLTKNEFSVAKTTFIKNKQLNRASSGTSGIFSKEYLDYVPMTDANGKKISSVMICYIIKCSASTDYNYNITSYGKPSVTKTSGKPGWFMDEISTNSKIEGKYVKISVSFRACWKFSNSGGSTVFRSDKKVSKTEKYNPLK